MTQRNETARFRRKHLVYAMGLILLALISFGLWYRAGLMERKRAIDALRKQLPPLPDTSAWPEAFAQALQDASDAVSPFGTGVEGLGELAMLYHANSFLMEAETCYTLLHKRDQGEPRWAYYLADMRLNWGDLAFAESHLRKVVALQPTYLPAQLRLGDVLLKSGKPESAHEAYIRCLQLDATNVYALLGIARERLRQGEEEEVLSLLSRMGETNGGFGPGYMLMAQLLDKKGERYRAEVARALGQKHGRYRESPDPWMDTLTTRCYDLYRLTVLADIEVATRQFESALDILDRAENIAPESPKLHLVRGLAYSEMGDKKAAISAYRKALQFGGDATMIYGELVRLYRGLGEEDTAISMAFKGLEENPRSPDILSALAELLIEQGERTEAQIHLRKALQQDPSHLPSLRNLARTLWEEGRESEAMGFFQEVRRRSLLDYHSRVFLAQYYLEKDDLERGGPPLREAINLEPDNPELRAMFLTFLQQSGNRKAREGDYPGAAMDYQGALSGDPSNVELHLNLGVVHARMGNYEAAAESMEVYSKERPEDVNASIALGDVFWEKGEQTRARDYWQKALIVARGMRDSDPIIAVVEARLRQQIPDREGSR